MSWNEMRRWVEYFDLHPHLYHSEHRAEYMAAQVAAMVVNTYRSEPVLPEQFMINNQQEEKPDYSEIKAFFIAHGIEGKPS